MTTAKKKSSKTGGATNRLTRAVKGESLVTLTGTGGGQCSPGTYPGSDITNTSSDFQGDWRSADAWQRFDMFLVRSRSRQLERGNPWCIAFKRSVLNNVLGAAGFHSKALAKTSSDFGDGSEGVLDAGANSAIQIGLKKMGLAKNFTTRKTLSRRDVDRLQLARLVFDGEIFFRKRRGFANDFGFAWQIIDPDYCDHNLNRLEPNGNFIKMGVELDKTDKFPVAYWFLERRPSDQFYNYQQTSQSRYYRVPAEEIIHIFLQTEDSEQTRGWPWVFAASMNLFRQGKYEEAALINAVIGANKQGFFEKMYPEGFTPDGSTRVPGDQGSFIDASQAGAWTELPMGVKISQWKPNYPDAEFEGFCKAMLRSASAVFGTSYATTSGDLSEANFVSSRLGQLEEREQYMNIQAFLIEKWKEPGFDEELYRGILSRQIALPIAKFDKFNAPKFTGRRWPYVQPIQDMQAKTMALDNCTTSISAMIEEQGGDADETWEKIANDNKKMEKLGLKRVHTPFQLVDENALDAASQKPPKPAPVPKKGIDSEGD